MIKRLLMLILVLSVAAGFEGTAGAELIVIGTADYNGKAYKLIYEDDQELIWLDYSLPNNRWPQQMSLVSKMNEQGVLTYRFNSNVKVFWQGSWRLSLAVDDARKNGNDGTTSAGCNITTSEMGHLYYISLGNLGYYDTEGNPRPGWGEPRDQESYGLKNTGPFDNLRYDSYWTGTEYSVYPQHAWDFNTYFGVLDCQCFKGSYSLTGLAVRPAKVDIR